MIPTIDLIVEMGIKGEIETALLNKGIDCNGNARGHPKQTQTIRDVIDAYKKEGDVYVIIKRGKRHVTYRREEHDVLKRIHEKERKAEYERIARTRTHPFAYTINVTRKEVADQHPALDKLIDQVTGNFTATRILVHHFAE